MSNLSAFLHPVQVSEEKEIIISDRFVQRDEKGEPVKDKAGNYIPVPFKIRSLTQEENDALIKKARRTRRVNGQLQEQHDSIAYGRALIVAATVEPDFASEEMCQAYGVLDPNLVPAKMLNPGEYSKLTQAITELSGFEDDLAADEAKN